MTHNESRYAVDTLTRRGWRVEEPDLTHAEAIDAAGGLHFVGFEPQGVRLRQLDAHGDAPPRGAIVP